MSTVTEPPVAPPDAQPTETLTHYARRWWTDVKSGESPFIAALEQIGIPGAADVMNAVVVTAVLSCLNSGMYTGSRMLFALAYGALYIGGLMVFAGTVFRRREFR